VKLFQGEAQTNRREFSEWLQEHSDVSRGFLTFWNGETGVSQPIQKVFFPITEYLKKDTSIFRPVRRQTVLI
jgi:hypothetical protein